MKPKFSFDLTPDKALKYLRAKGFQLSFNYEEMIGEAHHKAFTVAKVTKLDLLQDIFKALDEALESGETFKDFKKRLQPKLQEKGWWGEREIINPKTGEVKNVYIGSRRLKNIFQTNMRIAYNVQRHKAQRALSHEVYWRYSSALLESTRESHSKLHGVILHRDNPFWKTNYPLNGWGCKCKVAAYSESSIKKRGWKITETTPESIAHKDWAYDIGAGSKLSKIAKINLDDSLSTLATLQSVKQSSNVELSETQLQEQFYTTLGVSAGTIYIDKVGDPMLIDDALFKSASGHSKIKKQNRHLYIDEIAKTIAEPDEIYLEWDIGSITGEKRLLKKMFKYYKTEKEAKRAFQVVFEYQKDKTIGVSAHVLDSSGGVEKKRIEKLIYRKED